MGTSMESIQYAYQGFAKQNYTMLDNLKLGYGGTKAEMERLLADAEKISGIHYDISNLNDVFDAIHVIQGELQITGTTAMEAEKTIEGSMNATKSAWQNLLTGLAKGGDLTPLINNLVESVMNLGQNLVPVIQNVISGLGTLASGLLSTVVPQIVETIPPLIEETLPMLIDSISTALDSIIAVLPRIIDAVSGVIPKILTSLLSAIPKLLDVGWKLLIGLVNGITQAAPELFAMAPQLITDFVDMWFKNMKEYLKAGMEALKAIVKGLMDALPELLEKAPDMIMDFVDYLIDALPTVLESGIEIVVSVVNGIIKALPKLMMMGPTLIFKLVDMLTQKLPEILQSGVKIVGSLIDGLFSMIGNLGKAAWDLGTKIIDTIKEFPGKLMDTGKKLIEGLWDGIKNSFDWIKNKFKEWVGNVLDFVKKLFGINSPSKLFRDEIGVGLAEGIGLGFSQEMKNVTNDMKDAIPTNWDVEGNLNTSKINKENAFEDFSYTQTVNAFKEALAGMTVEMDDENMGRFVRKTVSKAIYA